MNAKNIIRRLEHYKGIFIDNVLDGGFEYYSFFEWCLMPNVEFVDRFYLQSKQTGRVVELSHRRIWESPSREPLVHPIRCRPCYDAIPQGYLLTEGYLPDLTIGDTYESTDVLRYFGEAPWAFGTQMTFAGYKTERSLLGNMRWTVTFSPHVKFPDGTYRFMPKTAQKRLLV